MAPSRPRDRLALLATGLFVLVGPVLVLASTLGVLVLFGDLALGRVTPIEFLELYVLEVLLFAGFGYGVYRLTLWMVQRQVPRVLDAIERDDAGAPDDGSTDEP